MTDKEAMNWFENRMTCTSMPGAREMFALAASALRERIAGGWISVKDRLPPVFQDVILYAPNDSRLSTKANEGYYTGREFVVDKLAPDKSARITHWQPLPEPPMECER